MIFYLKSLLHLYLFTVVQGPIALLLAICPVLFQVYVLCKRFVKADYIPIHEGNFRFDELLANLKAFNFPKVVSVLKMQLG